MICACIRALFQKQQKHYPGNLEKFDFLRYGFFVCASAWLFQGLFYMGKLEALLKILWDLLLAFAFSLIGVPWYYALLLAHTLNFLLNGQCVAMFAHMGGIQISKDVYLREVEKIAGLLSHFKSVKTALVFGSSTRGSYSPSSDLDIRIVPESGFCSISVCAFLSVYLRITACLKMFPLDLYVFSIPVLIRKMRADEPPVALCGNMDAIRESFPHAVSFDEFRKTF